jgi:Pvc16 N-terminal domain
MLNVLDESLEAFLRVAVPLPRREVDVSFEAPDRDWGARVTRPTVNLFLWDVRRNLADQDAGLELHEASDGRRARRPPLPRIDCRYLVTAWTTEVRDEHSLLGAVLQACLLAPELPGEYLAAAYAEVRPLPSLRVGMPDGSDTADFWSALGGQLKPGLDLILTATVDTVPSWTAGPDIDTYELTTQVGAAGRRDRTEHDVEGTSRRTWVRRQ